AAAGAAALPPGARRAVRDLSLPGLAAAAGLEPGGETTTGPTSREGASSVALWAARGALAMNDSDADEIRRMSSTREIPGVRPGEEYGFCTTTLCGDANNPSPRLPWPSAFAPGGRCFGYSSDIGTPRPMRSRVTMAGSRFPGSRVIAFDHL